MDELMGPYILYEILDDVKKLKAYSEEVIRRAEFVCNEQLILETEEIDV